MINFDVVTHSNWIVEEFKELDQYDVKQNFGFDPPRKDAILWCPGEYAARLYVSGYELNLLSAGPRWLANLDWPWTKRRVWAGTAVDLYEQWDRLQTFKGPMHCKLAEAKDDRVPAKVYKSWKDFCDLLNKERIPLESYIQISDPVDYRIEARFYVSNKDTRSACVYRIGEYFYDHPDFMTKGIAYGAESKLLSGFLTDSKRFLTDLLENVDVPPGVVIDVGKDSDGNLSVVEANAAWSSNLYGYNANAIIKSIVLANSGDTNWLWLPDASQLQKVRPFSNV